jgi:hypothetical protein
MQRKAISRFMDNYHLKIQLIGEIQEAVRVKELNVELMEHLAFTANWILRYCENNNVKPPDLDKLLKLIDRSRQLIQRMYEHYSLSSPSPPTQNQHDFKHEDDSTEPNILLKYIYKIIY